MGKLQKPNPEALENWGKQFYYADKTSLANRHGENIELRLKQRPGHIWISWPDKEQGITARNIDISKIRVGDWVRVDFVAHHFAYGVHLVKKVRKLSFLERWIKLPLFGRV